MLDHVAMVPCLPSALRELMIVGLVDALLVTGFATWSAATFGRLAALIAALLAVGASLAVLVAVFFAALCVCAVSALFAVTIVWRQVRSDPMDASFEGRALEFLAMLGALLAALCAL